MITPIETYQISNINSFSFIANPKPNETKESQTTSEISDKAEISEESLSAYKAEKSEDKHESKTDKTNKSEDELTDEEKQKVEDLKKRDDEVRQHEQAHLAAAGNLALGPAQYEYEQGPDDKKYAVSGEVPLSISEGNTPEETIKNATQVKRAALAPAEPSSTDRSVAAKADAMIAKAQQELNKAKQNGEAIPTGFLVDTVA